MKNREKLIVGFGAISILSLMVISLIGYFIAKNIIESFVFQNVNDQIKINADAIKIQYSTTLRKLENDINIIHSTLYDPQRNSLLKIYSNQTFLYEIVDDNGDKKKINIPMLIYKGLPLHENPGTAEKLSELLNSYVTFYQFASNKFIRTATTLRLGNELVVTIEIGKRANGTYLDESSPIYRELIKGNTFVGSADILGRNHIIAARPVLINNSLIGAVSSEVKPEKMERLQDRMFASKIGKSGNIEIFNSKGLQIIHNTKEGMYRNNVNHRKMIRMKTGMIKADMSGDDLDALENHDTLKYYVFTYIEELDWYLAGNIYLEEFYQPIYTFRNIIIIVSILSFFLTIVLASIFSSAITKPINKVTMEMSKLVEESEITDKIISDTKSIIFKNIQVADQIDKNENNRIDKHFSEFKFQEPSKSDLYNYIAAEDEIVVFAEKFNVMSDKLRQLYKNLQNSEENYRNLFENLQDMFYRTDLEGNILMLSPSVKKILGYELEELINHNLQNEFYKNPDDRKRLMKELVAHGSIEEFETTLIKGDGTEVWISTNSHFFRDRDGNIAGVEGMVRDITSKKIYEMEIRKLNEELEESVAERTSELQNALENLQKTQNQLIQNEKLATLGSLVAGIAHEINTPIGNSVTASSYLEKQSADMHKLFLSNDIKKSDLETYIKNSCESAEIIQVNLLRASNLIANFKQLAVDQTYEEKRRFNVKKYINEEVLVSLRPKIKHTNIQVLVDCDNDIEIYNYPGFFSQILTILIMNTLLHGFENLSAGVINIDISVAENHLVIKYSDNGKGIPSAIIDKIFDPFFTTKRNKGGTGLGLHILYNVIVQKFKGTVFVSSEEGKGSLFTVMFPL